MDMKQLTEVLEGQLGIETKLITPSALIKKDLELDSTDTVVIALEIKKHLNIDFKFPDDDMTLQQLLDKTSELAA